MPIRPHAQLATALLAALALTGCGLGTAAPNAPQTIGTLSGVAMGGRQPIIGAAVTLYIAGKTGYGNAATVLGTATTDANGNFNITRNSNTCADPDQLYIAAAGGNPGSGTNSASLLVEALGNCSAITTATSGLVVNELTTVAAAYALSGFSTVDGSSVNISTSSTNTLGLQHAFANAANLVALNGVANTTTVGGNGTVPNAVLDSLADSLAACVNSTGAASTSCTAIFVAPPAGTTSTTPANTWQTALNWALYPGNNVAGVYANQSSSPPFQPNLSAAPADLSVGIAYYTGYETNGTTVTGFPWDIKADASDNIWIAGQTGAGLTELNSVGTVLSPAGGWGTSALQGASTRGIAFDNLSSPNVWVADLSGNVWAYNPATATTTQVALPTSITVGGAATVVAKAAVPVAVDAANNVWYGTYAGTATATQTLGEIPAGTFAAQTAFTNSPLFPESTKGDYSMTVDAKLGTIWAGSQTGGNVYTAPTSNASATAITTASTASSAINTIAQDGSGNTWAVGQGSGADKGILYKFSSASPSTAPTAIAGPTGASAGLYNPRGLAIDGIGRLFVISYSTPAAVVEYDPSLTTSSTPAGYLLNASSNGFAPVDNTGTTIIIGSGPRNATIDSTGSLWLSNGTAAGKPGAVQIFGIAAPTVAPLSKGKYGVRP